MGNTQSLCQEVAQEQEETVVPVEKLLGGESAKSPGSAATDTGDDDSEPETPSAEPHEPTKEIELRTAPIDPRFAGSNAARYCYVAYNEYHRCTNYKGDPSDGECLHYARIYRSLCPAEWIERWNELRDAGTWFGKY